jgi:hypothetical protein
MRSLAETYTTDTVAWRIFKITCATLQVSAYWICIEFDVVLAIQVRKYPKTHGPNRRSFADLPNNTIQRISIAACRWQPLSRLRKNFMYEYKARVYAQFSKDMRVLYVHACMETRMYVKLFITQVYLR